MPKRQSLPDLLFSSGAMSQSRLGYPEALSYIDGRWISGKGEAVKDLSPATGKQLGVFRDCSNEQVDLAFRASRIAQMWWAKENQHRKPDFNTPEIGILEKRKILDAFAHLLDTHRGELTRLIAEDMGKTALTADADIEESIHAAEHYRDIAHNAMAGEFRDAQLADKKAFTKRFPYGTVLAIKPFNFIALYWWSVCAAITAGNSVVVKASRDIPFVVNATVALFHKALSDVLGEKAEYVASLVQVLQGRGSTTGDYMAEHGDYDMISFTGSNEAAEKLQVVCARRNKRFHRETGGHAAIIVLDDFDLEKAANEIVQAAFGDAGQRCTSNKVVFAQDTIYDQLLKLVIKKAKKLRIGDPTKVETKIAPIINVQAFDGIRLQLNQTEDQLSRKPILGGIGFLNEYGLRKALKKGFNVGEEIVSGKIPHSTFLTPTIFTDVPYGVCAMDEEIFGPVLVFNKVSGADRRDVLENAVSLVNQSQYGLSSALLTNETGSIVWAFDHTFTGVWYGGRGTTGAEVPGYFSVVKESGSGHEAHGVEEYSWVKQGWLDTYPETRLAQTGAAEEIRKSMRKAESLFS